MSNITSISASSPSATSALANTLRSRSTASAPPTDDENSFASAICSFSEESLAKLSAAGQAGLNLVESGFDNIVEEIQGLGDDIGDLAEQGLNTLLAAGHSVESAATQVGHFLEDTADTAGSLIHSAADTVSDAATSVGDATGTVFDAIGTGAKNVGSYLALGTSMVRSILNEIA